MVKSRRQKAATILLFLLTCLIVETASAYHTESDRQTDFSAFTLKQNQLRLGLFQQEYGILNAWSVGTYTLPWLLIPITKSPSINLFTKVKFIDTGKWAASARVTGFFMDVSGLKMGSLDNGEFRANVLPMSLTVSHVFNEESTLSFESTWVQTILHADVDSVDDATALGAGAQSNFQLALVGEYRVTDVIALNLVTRYVPYVTEARIESDAQIDDATKIQIKAGIGVDELQHSWLIQPGITFSWRIFNLQMSAGYGDLFLPGLRLVGPVKTVVPDFDLFFRF